MIKKATNQHSFIYIVLFVFLLVTQATVSAHTTKTKGLISPSTLADNTSGYTVIDLRSVSVFTKQHIPKALSLPLPELSLQRLKSLGINTDDRLVLYSTSEQSAKKGKLLLEILEYTTIDILTGGFTHWLEDKQKVATGYNQTEIAQISQSDEPKIQVLPSNYDFGKIQQKDDIVSTRFEVKNSSNADIRITDITTSCGCTTAEIDNYLIQAQTSQVLTVNFNPNFHDEPEGVFSRTIFLQSSDDTEYQAKITVEIVKE